MVRFKLNGRESVCYIIDGKKLFGGRVYDSEIAGVSRESLDRNKVVVEFIGEAKVSVPVSKGRKSRKKEEDGVVEA
jgi:hypothetical protein